MNKLHTPHIPPSNDEVTAELGRELRTLREQKGLTVGDVAERLKLPVRQIEALENGLYGLLEPVYIRGFLLSYGRFLGMDETELMRHLNVIAPPNMHHHSHTAAGLNYANTRIKKGSPKWLFFVLVAGCIGFAIYLWQNKSNEENEKQTSISTIPVETTDVAAPNLNADNLIVKPMNASGMAASEETSASAANATMLPPAVVGDAASMVSKSSAAGELVITARYRTMLTVTNSEGKILINKIVPASSEHRFKNGAPFEVRMGYATGSKVSFAGQEVDLDSKPKDGKSVAFTVGDGSETK